MAKELTVNKIDFIEGGVSDFILHGKTDTGKRVKFWVPDSIVTELAEKLAIAGSPGHALWHHTNRREMPCELCSGEEQAQIAELERRLESLDPEQEGEEYEGKKAGLNAEIMERNWRLKNRS